MADEFQESGEHLNDDVNPAAREIGDRLGEVFPPEKLNNRQNALMFDTLGLLECVAEGRASGFARIRDNLVEIYSLFDRTLTPDHDREMIHVLMDALIRGAGKGITIDGLDGDERKARWQTRG